MILSVKQLEVILENNREVFSNEIELFVAKTGSSYLDAIIHVAEKKDIELESAAKMINKVIKQKLEWEAASNNLLKNKISTLPM